MTAILQIIVFGSAHLLYACAREVKNFYKDAVDLKIVDIAYTPLYKNSILEFGDVKIFRKKEEALLYLEDVKQPTYLLSVNNPYIFPPGICKNPWLTLINLHHGLLPYHRGRNAEAWTIFDMDELGGITWHYISPGIDTGDIICQRAIKISEDMTSWKLLKICEGLALNALREELLPLEKLNRTNAHRQDTLRMPPKKASDIPNDGYLDINWTWEKSIAFLRAMDYSALCVLGRPKVILENRTYIIGRYKAYRSERNKDSVELRPLDRKNFECVLSKGDHAMTLYLRSDV